MNPAPELAHQLKSLRLSGIMDSLDSRNRQAIVRISAMAATDFNLIADSVSLRRRTAFHRDRGHRRGRPSDRADVSAGGYRGG